VKDIIIEDEIDAPQGDVFYHGELEAKIYWARWMPAYFWEVRHSNVPTMTAVCQGYANSQKDAHRMAEMACIFMSGRAPGPSIIDKGSDPKRRFRQ